MTNLPNQAQFIAAGFPDPFYANLVEIASDEKTHVSLLTTALGSASIRSKSYLTNAGSVLTAEAHHSPCRRPTLKESPFPSPFDTLLDFNEVYTPLRRLSSPALRA
jgi:hypothetical protein